MSSSITPGAIYTGLWINWSKGQALGSTITVTASTGVILAAFVAIFVNLAAGHLWSLIAYAIHQSRDTTRVCHPIIRQQQVILKNCGSPISAANKLLQLMWAWPLKSQRKAFWSSFLLTLLAISCSVGGIIAGIFSSYIVDTTDIEVLISTSACGFWQEGGDTLNTSLMSTWQDETNAFYQAGVVDAISYATACYNASSLQACNTYAQNTIPWTTNWHADCPFDDMCIGDAMQMDTGLINTNDVFGLNVPKDQQIQFRRVTTCAPMVSDGYTETTNATDLPGDEYQYFLYGPTIEDGVVKENETWQSSLYQADETRTYTLGTILAYSGIDSEYGQWLPIESMDRTDADMTLMFLSSNSVRNTAPVNDPIFAAHRAAPLPYHGDVYYADNLTTTVGCTEQYQFCNPISNASNETLQCTVLSGLDDVYDTSEDILDFNPIQAVTVKILYHTVRFWGASIAVNAFSAPPNLLVMHLLDEYIQTELPDNQWQLEVVNWHAAALVSLQDRLVQRAVGPLDDAGRSFVNLPSTDAEAAICKAQKVKISSGFSNISTFGLAFVLTMGVLATIFGTFLSVIASLFAWCFPRKGRAKEKQRSWIRDDALQLQRLAYEGWGVGHGMWTGSDKDIPVMEGSFKLGSLGNGEDKADRGTEPLAPMGMSVMRRSTTDTSRLDVDSLLGVEDVAAEHQEETGVEDVATEHHEEIGAEERREKSVASSSEVSQARRVDGDGYEAIPV